MNVCFKLLGRFEGAENVRHYMPHFKLALTLYLHYDIRRINADYRTQKRSIFSLYNYAPYQSLLLLGLPFRIKISTLTSHCTYTSFHFLTQLRFVELHTPFLCQCTPLNLSKAQGILVHNCSKHTSCKDNPWRSNTIYNSKSSC